METWFYILEVISDSPYLKPGDIIVSEKSYFSKQTCEENARLVAQALFVKEGTKYGYRCKKVEYEPPNLGE